MFIPDGCAEVAAFTSTTGDPDFFATVFGFTGTVTFGTALADDISDILADFFKLAGYGGAAIQYGQNVCRYEGLHMIWRDGANLLTADSVSSAGAGSGTNSLVPQNTSYLVAKQSLLAGREHRGRMFLPWVLESTVDNVGVVGSSTVDSLQDRCDQLLQDLEDLAGVGDVGMILLHNDPTTSPDKVVALQVATTVSSQRRRLRR